MHVCAHSLGDVEMPSRCLTYVEIDVVEAVVALFKAIGRYAAIKERVNKKREETKRNWVNKERGVRVGKGCWGQASPKRNWRWHDSTNPTWQCENTHTQSLLYNVWKNLRSICITLHESIENEICLCKKAKEESQKEYREGGEWGVLRNCDRPWPIVLYWWRNAHQRKRLLVKIFGSRRDFKLKSSEALFLLHHGHGRLLGLLGSSLHRSSGIKQIIPVATWRRRPMNRPWSPRR